MVFLRWELVAFSPIKKAVAFVLPQCSYFSPPFKYFSKSTSLLNAKGLYPSGQDGTRRLIKSKFKVPWGLPQAANASFLFSPMIRVTLSAFLKYLPREFSPMGVEVLGLYASFFVNPFWTTGFTSPFWPFLIRRNRRVPSLGSYDAHGSTPTLPPSAYCSPSQKALWSPYRIMKQKHRPPTRNGPPSLTLLGMPLAFSPELAFSLFLFPKSSSRGTSLFFPPHA